MDITAILSAIARLSAQAGVLIVVILAAQRLFRADLTPRWRCALWLLLLARLILPFSFSTPVSIFNWVPGLAPRTTSIRSAPTPSHPAQTARRGVHAQPATAPRIPDPATALPAADVAVAEARVPAEISWNRVLASVWLGGVLVLAGQVVLTSVRVSRRFAKLPMLNDPGLMSLLAESQQAMGVAGRVRLVESADVVSPALHGLIHPCLLLPSGFRTQFSPAELRFIFLHELAHLRRRDLLVHWLFTLLQVLHWFNPLVWLGFARWRADRELACDALALEAVGPEKKREYGETILRLLEGFTQRAAMPGLVGIMEDRRELHRRIEMIASFRPGGGLPVMAVILIALVGAVCLTDARTPQSESVSTTVPLPPDAAPDQVEAAAMVSEAMPLDIARFYRTLEPPRLPKGILTPFLGVHEFDGLRFDIGGMAPLRGAHVTKDSLEAFRGIVVGRTFDELHVVGFARMPSFTGNQIASIRLNYADHTSYEFPIYYNDQASDWYHERGEEKEILSDPNSKIVMRAPAPQRGATIRIYKTVFGNPYPAKIVDTIDVISAMDTANYNLMAAVVANRDPFRPVTPPMPLEERNFDGQLRVQVLDAMTGAPVVGAAIEPGFTIDGLNAIGPHQPTSETGEVFIPYPFAQTSRVRVVVAADGYVPGDMSWTNTVDSRVIPDNYTFRLKKAEAATFVPAIGD
jgi:beta-lactamase regulating signal transducer with metallopeptidase domain